MFAIPVQKGQAVTYRDPVRSELVHRATCVGLSRKNGEQVVQLDDGHWCYESQVFTRVPQTPTFDASVSRGRSAHDQRPCLAGLKLVYVRWGHEMGLVSLALNEVICTGHIGRFVVHLANVPVAELTNQEMNEAFHDEPGWGDVPGFLLTHAECIGAAV